MLAELAALQQLWPLPLHSPAQTAPVWQLQQRALLHQQPERLRLTPRLSMQQRAGLLRWPLPLPSVQGVHAPSTPAATCPEAVGQQLRRLVQATTVHWVAADLTPPADQQAAAMTRHAQLLSRQQVLQPAFVAPVHPVQWRHCWRQILMMYSAWPAQALLAVDQQMGEAQHPEQLQRSA